MSLRSMSTSSFYEGALMLLLLLLATTTQAFLPSHLPHRPASPPKLSVSPTLLSSKRSSRPMLPLPHRSSSSLLKYREGEEDESQQAVRERNILEQFEKGIRGPEPLVNYVMKSKDPKKPPQKIPLPEEPNKTLVLLSVITALALGALGVFVGNFVSVPPLATLSLSPSAGLQGILLALPLVVVDAVLEGAQEDTASEVYSLSIFGTKTPLTTVLGLAAAVTFATGMGEEILFRGLIQKGISYIVGGWLSVPIAAVIFGLAHKLGPSDLAFITISGAYMGGVYQYTGDLTVPVFLHFAYDFLILVSAFFRAKKRIARKQ